MSFFTLVPVFSSVAGDRLCALMDAYPEHREPIH
jgi:hypothetical protein